MPASSAALAKARRSSNKVASGRLPCSTWSKSPFFIAASARRRRRLVDFRLGDLPPPGGGLAIAAFVGLGALGGACCDIAAHVGLCCVIPCRRVVVVLRLCHAAGCG